MKYPAPKPAVGKKSGTQQRKALQKKRPREERPFLKLILSRSNTAVKRAFAEASGSLASIQHRPIGADPAGSVKQYFPQNFVNLCLTNGKDCLMSARSEGRVGTPSLCLSLSA